MILAPIDLLAERWELARLVAAILQPVLLIALSGGLVLASAHLITMLGTRWGRRRVSQKALVFSIVVHLSLVCGILALWPEAVPGSPYTLRRNPERPAAPPPEAFNVVPVPDLPVSRAEAAAAPATAIWNRLPDDLARAPERTEPAPRVFEEPAERRPDPLELPPAEIAVASPLPTPVREAPEPAAAIDVAIPELPRPVRSVDAALSALNEIRAETLPPSVERERSVLAPDSLPGAEAIEAAPRPEAAPVERLAPRPNIDERPTSVAGVVEEPAMLRQTDEGVEIVRPEGPSAARLPTPDAAPAVAADSSTAAADAPLGPSMSRERTRITGRAPAAEPVEVPRVRPEIAPAESRPRGPSVAIGSAVARDAIPTLERPPLDLPASGGGGVPAPYRLRATDERKAATKQFGGNPQSERAVELSLQWLADNQTPDGFWDASAHGAGSTRVEGKDHWEGVGAEADAGLTGLAVLAFLGPMESLGEGPYAENVERALRWLVSQQRGDGGLGGAAGKTDYAYCHAMATFALAEACALSGSQGDDWLRLPVQRAIQFTVDSMTTDGGWRYQKGNAEGDMSVFGWQLMALKSAELAGIPIAKPVQDKMVRFLIARSLGASGGLAAYRPREAPTPSMTAEALYCKQRLGISRDNPACAEAVAFLLRSLPQRAQMNYYYWYYGSLAMRQYGGDEWTQWNEQLRDLLVQDQRQDGALAGSWDPNDPWGRYGGRVYSTALATLCLEVYYRYGDAE